MPIISKRRRCAAVALDNRHDHASGTLMVRPSFRRAMMLSRVTLRVTILGSLLATVLIPGLVNALGHQANDVSNAVQFRRREAPIIGQGHRFQPELAGLAFPAHMDMPRFITVKAVEEDAVRSGDTADRWQGNLLSFHAHFFGVES